MLFDDSRTWGISAAVRLNSTPVSSVTRGGSVAYTDWIRSADRHKQVGDTSLENLRLLRGSEFSEVAAL